MKRSVRKASKRRNVMAHALENRAFQQRVVQPDKGKGAFNRQKEKASVKKEIDNV
tara:strand:+ start:2713 stop:2877 length:165 start_codon:yes stop_codon:yes gene_type:complete